MIPVEDVDLIDAIGQAGDLGGEFGHGVGCHGFVKSLEDGGIVGKSSLDPLKLVTAGIGGVDPRGVIQRAARGIGVATRALHGIEVGDGGVG